MAATSYLLLFSGGGMPQTDAETKQVMDAWQSWMGKHNDAITDPGNPFSPNAKTITKDGTVTDGPVGTPASGYVVIKADSMDKAIEIAKGCPVFLGGAKISLYETFDVMSMAGAGGSPPR
jgi:hypothetical protein